MAKIGIITCQILELEFAYVLSADTEVSDVFVVDNEFSAGCFQNSKATVKSRCIDWQPLRNSGKRRATGTMY